MRCPGLLGDGDFYEVQFGSTPTYGLHDKPTKSIPFLFFRSVKSAPDARLGLVETGDWSLSEWKPGKGA